MALSNEDLKAIESLLEPIKCDIRSIQLTLENEKEMLLIRVNSLENELRKVKERIESIA